nr:unnamed protein product [Callosobruchus chinensis]
MMESDEWKSEWAADQEQPNKCSSLISFEDGELVEYSNDNEVLNATQDSIESTAPETDDKIEFILKPSLKGITQAKKRLKAFTASKLLKNVQVKEKNLNSNKSEANTTKKLKKELYPDERARAVIQEIEEIKKAQARQQFQHAFVDPITNFHTLPVGVKPKSRSRSISSGDERLPGHFKRREIKVRNIRRGETGSVSPETYNKKKSEKLSYPKNWSEFFQQNLDTKKDQELKSKLFPSYKRQNVFDMYRRIYNPQIPSMRIEPFLFSTNSGSKQVPPFFVRFTKTYPPVQYSINSTTHNESFITRKQLYSIISKEAKEIIEKLINSNHRSPAPKMLKERQWFNKSWRKIGTGESKFVENSVGLSFLQNYSDDDNDANDEEEIIICSRVTTSEKPSDQQIFEDMEGTVQSECSEKIADVVEKQDALAHIEDNAEMTVDMPEQIPNEILSQTTEQICFESSQDIPEKTPQESIERTPEVLPEEIPDAPILDENEVGQTPDVRSSDGFRTPELRPKSVTEDRELDETRRAIEQLKMS